MPVRFSGECVRFDCIETKEHVGIESKILWIPVTDQLDKMEFIEEGIFA